MKILEPSLHDDIAKAAALLDELVDAADYEAIAWNLHEVKTLQRALSDLVQLVEDTLIDIAPWTGDELLVDGLPVMQLRTGTERKAWRWDEVRPYLRRRLLDPDFTGEVDPTVEAATDAALDLMFTVAPLTRSNGPRVKAIGPILRQFDRDVDEFCDLKPGRRTVQFHEAVAS